jgi:adenylate cyclase
MDRRLTTILAADLVGYSRLMAADEEGVIARLRAARSEVIDPAIAEAGGRIVKTMGDGLLVEFGSPVAAVRTALVVQRAMAARETGPEERRLTFRIGVNLGDIVIDGDDILGDGVNIAARLETLAPPGGLCISRTVHDQVRGKLDAVLTPLGPQPVKNLPEPVEVWRVEVEGARTAPVVNTGQRPSVAVLPFDNMSRDADQDFLADGIVEDVISELSRFRDLTVIARNSSFSFRGQALDVRKIAQELGVRYVVEGSVRRSGDRLRLTAQLIDASDGSHLWAGRWDRTMADLFDLQDELTRAIVSAVAPEVSAHERSLARKKPT